MTRETAQRAVYSQHHCSKTSSSRGGSQPAQLQEEGPCLTRVEGKRHPQYGSLGHTHIHTT